MADDQVQPTTSDSTETQLPVGEGQNGSAPVPAPNPQNVQPPVQQAPPPPPDPLANHPAVQQASVIRRIGETIAGGPRVKTTVDPQTGTITREKEPLSSHQILTGALANILGGIGQVSSNLSNRMAGRSPNAIQPLPTQQAQQKQAQQSQQDFEQEQQAKLQKAKILNANMEAMRTAYAIGKEDDEAKDSVVTNHADDLEEWNKSGAVEASQVPSDELLKKGFDKSKYVAVPDGKVPVFNADGKRATNEAGVPLSQLTYSVVDGTTQTPLSQDKYDQLAKYGLMQAKQGFNLPEGATISSASLALMNHKMDLIQQTQRELDEVTGGDKVDLAAQIKKNPQMLSAIEKFHNDAASTQPDRQIDTMQRLHPQAAGMMRELFGNDNLEKFKQARVDKDAADKVAATTSARVNAEAATPEGQQKLKNEQLTGQKDQLEIEKLKNDSKNFDAGDISLTGDAYLKSLPEGSQSLVRELGTGKIGLNRLDYLVTRKPEVLEAVSRAYPDFDSTKVQNYINTSKDFTSGKTSAELVAGGTALKHLSELKELNTIESRIPGTADYQRFQNKLQTVSPELARFYGNTTEGGIASYEKTLGSFANRDAAIQTQAQSMGDRLDSYEQKWKNAAPSAAYQAPLPNIDSLALKSRAKLDPAYAARVKGQPPQQGSPQNGQKPAQDKQTILQSITLPGGGHPADLAYAKDGSLLVWSGKAGDGWVSATGK